MKQKEIYRKLDAKGRITVPADYIGAEDGYQIIETHDEDGERRIMLVPAQD